MSLSGDGTAHYVPRSAAVTCCGKQKHDTGNWTSLGVNKRRSSLNIYIDGCFIRPEDTIRRDTIRRDTTYVT